MYMQLNRDAMARCPVVGDDDECPRRKVDLWHNHLRQVTIIGFSADKSLVELTVHILERLTLDTTCRYHWGCVLNEVSCDREAYDPHLSS
jgi:hypothetical protein